MTRAVGDAPAFSPRLLTVMCAALMFLVALLTAGLVGEDWRLGLVLGAAAALGTLTARKVWRNP